MKHKNLKEFMYQIKTTMVMFANRTNPTLLKSVAIEFDKEKEINVILVNSNVSFHNQRHSGFRTAFVITIQFDDIVVFSKWLENYDMTRNSFVNFCSFNDKVFISDDIEKFMRIFNILDVNLDKFPSVYNTMENQKDFEILKDEMEAISIALI